LFNTCASAGNQSAPLMWTQLPDRGTGGALHCSAADLHAVNPFESSAKFKLLLVYPVAATRRHIANASCSPIPIPSVRIQSKADVTI
jgi:hypothetical protein